MGKLIMQRKQKNQYFNALLYTTGTRLYKSSILESCGVTSTTDLSDEQIDTLIRRLEEMQVQKSKEVPRTIRSLRSRLIIECERYLDCEIVGGNWERLNSLLLSPKIAGKMMVEMTEQELKDTIAKMVVINRKSKKKAEAENELAVLN